MSGQAALGRTLEMMAMMSRFSGGSLQDMVEHFGVSARTIERTIQTLRRRRYSIDCRDGVYYLNKEETRKVNSFDMDDLVHFTREEAYVLNRAISNIEPDTSLRENLVRKLDMLYDTDRAMTNLVRKEETEAIKLILEAIRNKTQVFIWEYSESTGNRHLKEFIIEPLGFVYNYSRLWAYVPKFNDNIVMHLSTVAGVRKTEKPFEHTNLHKVGYMDPFRSYGSEKKQIRLLLNVRSYGHMIDEFPLTREYITRAGSKHYMLDTEVCNFWHVGRFILGLPEDIIIVEPAELKDYIRDRVKKGIEQLEKNSHFLVNQKPAYI